MGQQWGTLRPQDSVLTKFFSTFRQTTPDNTNVNILRAGTRMFALSDFSTMVEFDPETLATKGKLGFADRFGPKFMLTLRTRRSTRNRQIFNVIEPPRTEEEKSTYTGYRTAVRSASTLQH